MHKRKMLRFFESSQFYVNIQFIPVEVSKTFTEIEDLGDRCSVKSRYFSNDTKNSPSSVRTKTILLDVGNLVFVLCSFRKWFFHSFLNSC
jgi:hypothetical protein